MTGGPRLDPAHWSGRRPLPVFAVHPVSIVLIVLTLCLSGMDAVITCDDGELTDNYGVVVSPGYPQTYPVNMACHWHIAPNVTTVINSSSVVSAIQLDFSYFRTQVVSADSSVEILRVYISDPANGSEPVKQFSGKQVTPSTQVTFPATEIWLTFFSASSPHAEPYGDILGFRIVYLAIGAPVSCDGDPLPNGSILSGNESVPFGVTVVFSCDYGYRMDGESRGTCQLGGEEVIKVSPVWSSVPRCLSTCLAPPLILNADHRASCSSSTALPINCTVTYSCHPPYLLASSLHSTLQCLLDDAGRPRWSGPLPDCVIPDCSIPISITSSSGVLVNPSFPQPGVAGGRNCIWDIRVEDSYVVHFNISYFDVPAQGELAIRDGITRRQLAIMRGGGEVVRGQLLNSTSSRVELVYNSAPDNSTDNQGFYIVYSTVVPTGQPVQPAIRTTSASATSAPKAVVTSPSGHGRVTSEKDGDASEQDSGSAGPIAAGVTVTFVIVFFIVGLSYWCYRKRYPVRMILGRDFGKFSNPEYRAPSTMHTLVREDAEEFFQQTQPSGRVNLVLGDGEEESKAHYVNVAFEYDSKDADEEEVERRFRERKAYLFKKDEDKVDGAGMANGSGYMTSKTGSMSTSNGYVIRGEGHVNEAFSGDSDVDSDLGNDETDSGPPAKPDKEDGSESSSDSDSSSSNAVDTSGKRSAQDSQEKTNHLPSAGLVTRDGNQAVGQTGGGGAGMTVGDFLRLAKEKRAMSDTSRVRAGSLTSFDPKMSARRRAQSAADIWSENTNVSVQTPKLDVTLLTSSTITATTPQMASHGHQEHVTSDNLTETLYENVTNTGPEGKTTEKMREGEEKEASEVTAVETKREDVSEQEENTASRNEKLDGAEEEAGRDVQGETKDREMDNSASSAFYQQIVPSAPASGETSPTQSSTASNSDSSLERVPFPNANVPYMSAATSLSLTDVDDAVLQNGDVTGDYENMSSLSITSGECQSSCAQDSLCASSTAESITADGQSPRASASNGVPEPVDRDLKVEYNTDTSQGREPTDAVTDKDSSWPSIATEQYPGGAQDSEVQEDFDVTSIETSSSLSAASFSMEPRGFDDSADNQQKSGEQDVPYGVSMSSRETSSPSGTSFSMEPRDFDDSADNQQKSGERNESYGVSMIESTNHQSPASQPKRAIAVQGLSTLSFSDVSSMSSSSDDDQDDHRQSSLFRRNIKPEPVHSITMSSGDVEDELQESGSTTAPPPVPQSPPPDLPSQTSDSQPTSSLPQPRRLGGLAALRASIPSDSDAEDMTFTTDDIKAILTDSDEATAFEDKESQGPQTSPGPAVVIKPQPQAFVFSQDSDDDFEA